MIDETFLRKLAHLARIEITESEATERLGDFQSILKCIDALQSVTIPPDFVPIAQSYNHARADEVLHASPESVARIIEAFPENQLGRLAVHQVVSK
jgi:aspartyl/glutamyl-tRNA(Asn/Gln) amidotransferase C subunit